MGCVKLELTVLQVICIAMLEYLNDREFPIYVFLHTIREEWETSREE